MRSLLATPSLKNLTNLLTEVTTAFDAAVEGG